MRDYESEGHVLTDNTENIEQVSFRPRQTLQDLPNAVMMKLFYNYNFDENNRQHYSTLDYM